MRKKVGISMPMGINGKKIRNVLDIPRKSTSKKVPNNKKNEGASYKDIQGIVRY